MTCLFVVQLAPKFKQLEDNQQRMHLNLIYSFGMSRAGLSHNDRCTNPVCLILIPETVFLLLHFFAKRIQKNHLSVELNHFKWCHYFFKTACLSSLCNWNNPRFSEMKFLIEFGVNRITDVIKWLGSNHTWVKRGLKYTLLLWFFTKLIYGPNLATIKLSGFGLVASSFFYQSI